ncbi:MAG: hypothetical protein PSX71_07465 [bacterium]|nr:hypothetical protein [bacterium]
MKIFPGLLWLLLAGVAQADVILGAQVGTQSLAIRQTDGLGNTYEDTADSRASLGLVLGVGQPGGNSRISVGMSRFAIGSDADLALLNAGYTWLMPSLTPPSFLPLRPFVGAELGYGWLVADQQSLFNSGDDSGLIYGARAGLGLAITDRAEIEAGVRYGVVNLDAALPGKLPGVQPAHFEVESSRGWWIGFNVGL